MQRQGGAVSNLRRKVEMPHARPRFVPPGLLQLCDPPFDETARVDTGSGDDLSVRSDCNRIDERPPVEPGHAFRPQVVAHLHDFRFRRPDKGVCRRTASAQAHHYVSVVAYSICDGSVFLLPLVGAAASGNGAELLHLSIPGGEAIGMASIHRMASSDNNGTAVVQAFSLTNPSVRMRQPLHSLPPDR